MMVESTTYIHAPATFVPTSWGWETQPTAQINHCDDEVNAPIPSYCVDYLTHRWDSEDLAHSWRAISKSRHDSIKCKRLENASWRIWAQQRNRLPTLHPSQLNWHKDNDITWLYGPLLTKRRPSVVASLTKSQSFTSLQTLKPALKKRTSWGDLRLFSKSPSVSSCSTGDSSVTNSTLVTEAGTPYKTEKPRLRFNAHVEQYQSVSFDNTPSPVMNSEPSVSVNTGRRNTIPPCTVTKLHPTTLKPETPNERRFGHSHPNPYRRVNRRKSINAYEESSSSLDEIGLDEDGYLENDDMNNEGNTQQSIFSRILRNLHNHANDDREPNQDLIEDNEFAEMDELDRLGNGAVQIFNKGYLVVHNTIEVMSWCRSLLF